MQTPREASRGAGWSARTWTTGRRSTPSTTSAASWNRSSPRSRRCTGTAHGAAGRTTGQGRSRSAPRHRTRGQVAGKRRQAHTGPNRNTRSVTGVFNTAPFLAEPPHHVLDLEDFMGCGGTWRSMGCHWQVPMHIVPLSPWHRRWRFFITRTHPRVFTSLDRSNDGGVPILSSGKRMSDTYPYEAFPHFHSPSLHQICSTVSDPRRLSPHIENVA